MTTLIEEAAKRLQVLRQSGITVDGLAVRPARAERTLPPDVPPAPELPVMPRPAESASASASASAVVAFVETNVEQAAEPSKTAFVAAPIASPSRSIELDLKKLAAAGIVTPSAPRSLTADQFRVIKRPLLNNLRRKGVPIASHANLIMVSSAVAGEGKSFTSINLAMSIATELDNTVMLVDADVARPSLPRMLGMPEGPGLLDVLGGSATMVEALLRTNVDKLTILSSGRSHPRATEMLASDAMRDLLDDISKRYADRVVIFDSPPLLLTTESRVLASNMGQVVIVVHAGSTLRSEVQRALATIEACPVKMMLLNQIEPDSGTSSGLGYGYGYGYGYGHGYGSKAQGA